LSSPTEKKCTKCNSTKPVSEFGVMNSRNDSLNPYCKACIKAVNETRKKRQNGV
jgi:hypothetical protein